MSNRMADLQSCLKLAIAMRDPDLIQSVRDDIQDYKEEHGEAYDSHSHHRTNAVGNRSVN